MRLTPITIATLLATAEAVLITKPATGDTVDLSQNWEVCWTAVDTDPATFCLYLTNFIQYPPQIFSLLNQQPVSRDAGCVTIPGTCYPASELRTTYRVRAAVCGDPNTIFAESGDFNVDQTTCPAASPKLRRAARL
ncbi:uncharacterized protein KD926_010682 [Aspergillus affinis]|uniref:uncharacterized protein n=1 Tax=Aspergillus affinis TaxID=1070780 RepID=UPI0022FE18A7|nr:uncharacterized protein KD926_010682 [Aspergillus affinis]KAI9038553.1 hypothetical protein KD926_010682 [Aspergillus affinis]